MREKIECYCFKFALLCVIDSCYPFVKEDDAFKASFSI